MNTSGNTASALRQPPADAGTDWVLDLKLREMSKLDPARRLKLLVHCSQSLRAGAQKSREYGMDNVVEIAEVFMNAFCVAKKSLEENDKSPLPQKDLESLMREIRTLIDNFFFLIEKLQVTSADLARLDLIETGSRTIDHTLRVFILFVSFLRYYDEYVFSSGDSIALIRNDFREKFAPLYSRLMPESPSVTLDHVFKQGLAAIQGRSNLVEYALGALLHDIGMSPNLHPTEEDEGNPDHMDTGHVLDSFNLLAKSHSLSWGVVSAGLLHHDYYGSGLGTKQLKNFRSLFPQRSSGPRRKESAAFVVSFDIADIIYYDVHAYFPNKMLEIVDLFEHHASPSLRNEINPVAARCAMSRIKDRYICGDVPGIDPVLFNIFIDFLKASEVLGDSARMQDLKI